MSDGTRILTISRHNPVNAFTLGGIVRDAGFSVEEFQRLPHLAGGAQADTVFRTERLRTAHQAA